MAIDRREVVARHDVVLREPDAQIPLTVGNGNFACTVDITGMQTFTRFHDPANAGDRLVTNTCTQSTWGWHEMPSPEAFGLEDALTSYKVSHRDVLYPDKFDIGVLFGARVAAENVAGTWLHVNPHRIDLGRTGLLLRDAPGAEPEQDPSVLTNVFQRLDLWSGIIHSAFEYAGREVKVTTAAHPDRAQVAFRIESPLLTSGMLEAQLAFPYASDDFFLTSDWSSQDRHATSTVVSESSARIARTLDATRYTVQVAWNSATVQPNDEAHTVRLIPSGDTLELVVSYEDGDGSPSTDSTGQVFQAAARWWESFWLSGAAIDFGRSTDPRANELERRVVLSQYLTAVNCSGVTPPQETGLVANSWHGKFHLEMHWLHAAHFVPWGRPELLTRSLDWYRKILPAAKSWAHRQGYEGARWPKQVGPDGRESPGEIATFLVWQQPHLLYFAELLYRREPSREMLERYAEIVEETARFMASFPEERDGHYHLATPLVPAQECYDRHSCEDPTFELAYWWWGLEIAQRWRERLGLERDTHWTHVMEALAPPHQHGGAYTAIATEPYLKREDHPSMLAAYGFVPGTPLVDPDVMRVTLSDVLDRWDWDSTWGWDFPLVAMTAARLQDAQAAVDALLMDRAKNQYLKNGHNAQRGNRLPLYLPGNGALLAAVSLMAGGWDGADSPAPGFPKNGAWEVEAEGFDPWP